VCHEIHLWLLGFVLEISIPLSFLHSELSNKVIFPQPALLYSLVIFESDVLFRKTDLLICHPIMDDSSYRRNFDLDKKNETITIAGKSILK
jgi:hypothetical protein